MVAASSSENAPRKQASISADQQRDDLRWTSINVREVLKKGLRLKAAVFDIEGRLARETLEQSQWPLSTLTGPHGLAVASHRPRFKRLWVGESDLPIYQPGQICELNPRPTGYLSPLTKTDIEALRVREGQILLTCSGRAGSIGRAAFVSRTLHGRVFSHDLIRIDCRRSDDAGYVYAFLRTKTGRTLIRTNEYGAMIPHIEPFHLDAVPIPEPASGLKQQIDSLVRRSYSLRDESNELLATGESLLLGALDLPPLGDLKTECLGKDGSARTYGVKLSNLEGRLDGSYHVPIVELIQDRLRRGSAKVIPLGDPQITKNIVLPGRFTRVYVQEGQGPVYFTGKHMLELDPEAKKYLSFSRHARRIREELTIRENTLLISCSGNLGKTVLCPQHWDGWVMTHDVIRVVSSSVDLAGYLWVFLSSDYGKELIDRYSYGAVVQHVERQHIASLGIPVLQDHALQLQINRIALEANRKRAEAYRLEKEAVRIVDEDVFRLGTQAAFE